MIRMFLGLPDPDPYSQRYGSGYGFASFPFVINVLSGLKKCLQSKILTQILAKNKIFKTEYNVPVGTL
jgi:hypothetical protein